MRADEILQLLPPELMVETAPLLARRARVEETAVHPPGI
jgi:hypothetical protein